MVTLEYDTQKLEFLLTINKLEISNINRFYDNRTLCNSTCILVFLLYTFMTVIIAVTCVSFGYIQITCKTRI